MFEDVLGKDRIIECDVVLGLSNSEAGEDPKNYLVMISNQEGPVVGIDYDGKVIVYQKGKDLTATCKEAAEIFWTSLEDYFKEHFIRIEKVDDLMHE